MEKERKTSRESSIGAGVKLEGHVKHERPLKERQEAKKGH